MRESSALDMLPKLAVNAIRLGMLKIGDDLASRRVKNRANPLAVNELRIRNVLHNLRLTIFVKSSLLLLKAAMAAVRISLVVWQGTNCCPKRF